jgi:hypothetical protein
VGEFVKCRLCGTACRSEAAASHLAVAHGHHIQGIVDRLFEAEAEEAVLRDSDGYLLHNLEGGSEG